MANDQSSLPPARERDQCADYNPSVDEGPYGYQPSMAVGVIFTTLFALAIVPYLVFTAKFRAWWLILFVLGALSEVIGWAARVKSHSCPYHVDAFIIQTATLIFAPAFIQGGLYVTLHAIMARTGSAKVRAWTKIYLIACVVFDVLCLALQAAGGGKASSAFSDGSDPKVGTNIMIVGIAIQLAVGVVFFCFTLWVLKSDKENIQMSTGWYGLRNVAIALLVATTALVVRAIYRVIELAQGWHGKLITDENYFIALDAVPVMLSLIALSLVSPGPAIKESREYIKSEKEKAKAYGDTEVGKEASSLSS